MKIKDLKKTSKDIWVAGRIIDKSPIREFEKFEKLSYVAHTILEDSSGSITLVLWNDQIHEFNKGDIVVVDQGYIVEWGGKLQLNSKKIFKGTETDLISDEDVDKKFHVVKISKQTKLK